MNDKYKFKLRRCNSASTLSGCIQRGCIQRNLRNFIIALPIDAETIGLLEKTLIRGFSLVNTRLSFDTNILMQNSKVSEIIKRKDLEIGHKMKN